MKKTVINLLGVITVFTLAFGVYSPKEYKESPVIMNAEHGDYGG